VKYGVIDSSEKRIMYKYRLFVILYIDRYRGENQWIFPNRPMFINKDVIKSYMLTITVG